MRRLRKFLNLPESDQKLLIAAFFLVASVRLALWTLPFSCVRRCVIRLSAGSGKPPSNSLSRLAGSIDLASRFIPHATCLTKALAAQILMARFGHKPLLRIGVRRDESGNFQAHAWLEDGGVVIGGLDDLHTYSVLPPV
jgi:hypothetical protein